LCGAKIFLKERDMAWLRGAEIFGGACRADFQLIERAGILGPVCLV
jgi:hypothetical protein